MEEKQIPAKESTTLDQKNHEKKPKKKKKIGKIIGNIILALLIIIIVAEALLGIINMQKINKGEEPVWYFKSKITEHENKTVTEYNLGLYRIVKTDTEKDSKTVLKPFFIQD